MIRVSDIKNMSIFKSSEVDKNKNTQKMRIVGVKK